MPKKTIIIFITVFAIAGLIVLGLYLLSKKGPAVTEDGTAPWYQNFNPFGTENGVTNNNNTTPNIPNDKNQEPGTPNIQASRFHQITDFAIAGATFLEDIRPVVVDPNTPEPEQITVLVSADTKEGRKEIQTILNTELSPQIPLTLDGNFGKLTTQAIKDFQKLKNLAITGKIDAETAPFFTKTTTTDLAEKPKYEQAPSIRYVERMNGHIYKMFLDTKIKEKISNSTIPSIYEAFFDTTGQTVIYRYLSEDKTINSFIATLGAPKGEFLPQNISDLNISQDKTKFFYLTENSNGVTGVTGTFGNTKREMVFNSPFTEWLSQWTSGQKIYLTTKASYSANGSVFLLDTTNKTLSKIFGGIMGLTTMVNPSGSLVLYSTSTKTGPRLGVFDIAQHSTKDLGVYGLPEKCVWNNNNLIYCAIPNTIIGSQYPDSWYQGLVSFDDYFLKINTTTGEKTTLANSINEIPIDGTHLFLDQKEENLFFINKKDSTLWSLNLK